MSASVNPERAALVPAIGADLIRIADVALALSRFGARYTNRLFTPAERLHCEAGGSVDTVARRYAGRFAAKEATFKALRWGNRATDWRQVEVRSLSDGACEIDLHGSARALAESAGIDGVAVSLTYTTDHAAAVVLAWRTRAA